MEWLDEIEILGGINSNKKRKKKEISYTKIESRTLFAKLYAWVAIVIYIYIY